jgi:hypothetical protein
VTAETVPMISITHKHYQELVRAQELLWKLQEAGVDSWEGYDGAYAAYRAKNPA